MVWKRVKIRLCLSNEKATFQGPFTVIFGSISRITVQWERSFCSTPSCLGFNCKQILRTMNCAVSQQIRAALKPACISQKPFYTQTAHLQLFNHDYCHLRCFQKMGNILEIQSKHNPNTRLECMSVSEWGRDLTIYRFNCLIITAYAKDLAENIK